MHSKACVKNIRVPKAYHENAYMQGQGEKNPMHEKGGVLQSVLKYAWKLRAAK